MQCRQCQYENLPDAAFCQECGAKLQNVCSQCQTENLPTAKFCRKCGTPLARQSSVQRLASSVQKEVEPDSQPLDARLIDSRRVSGERRQLTVMFCDLVGSTPLAEQLDPEELREVVRVYQEACAAVIHRFEGYIARYVGDALLVYFGYPAAHEDDAQRAVRAGLGIVEAVHELPLPNIRLPHPLQVRIGIHSGLVVVGEMGNRDYREAMALGETPNVAARLQGLAEPDAIVISAATHRLLGGLFEYHDLGSQTLKGVSAPVRVFRILGESHARSRLEGAAATGLTPLVGREEEAGLLLKHWEQVKEGQGQVVLLSGEAGIGKSRLLQVLTERVAKETHTRLECRCSPYYQNTALYPVIDLLQRVLQFKREDSPQEKFHKLEIGAVREAPLQPEVIPLFASLLSLPLPDRYPALILTPQKQKEKTQQAMLTWLLREAERQPVCFAVEDMHWADPSTLEFLGLLIDQVPTARVLIVLTSRPEFVPPWPSRSYVTSISLSRLARAQTEVMVERVTGGKALPAEILQQIVGKTDGVPLFVEELTKMVLESGLLREEDGRYVGMHGHAPLPPLAIPSTLQDSLMARLDRLATVKEVAQMGATLGREFSYDLLQAVASVNEASLQHALAKLVEAEVLYQRGLPPQARYLFKHALIQDAAYQSLLKSRRQQYHRQIAQVLEERFSDIKETQPELLAHHYTEAGLTVQAIPYWQQAGQRAAQRSASVEAINHLTKGLDLLKTLPNTPERTQQELALQLALGNSLMATKGYAAPEVEQTYTRALELCRQMGEPPQLFPVLVGLWRLYLTRAEHKTARELGEQCLSLAQRVHNPVRLLGAHQTLGVTLFYVGEFAQARAHLEQALALYDPQKHRSHAFRGGQDPAVACLSHVAWTLWSLGYPDQALRRSHEALALAQELSHSLSLAQALVSIVRVHQHHREGQLAQGRAEALITLSTDQGFAFTLAWGTIMRGWALAEQGQTEAGIAQIRQGLAAYRATGAEALRPYFLALLAEAYGKAGQVEEGLSTLAEALAIVDNTGERFYEAELYRLKGELSLQSGVRGPESAIPNPQPLTPNTQLEAEACFLKAIDIARRQQAKSLELRAVMSLARLWQQQGKANEARQMLAEIYGWFTEGFDTADLQEAKALLEKLNH